MAPTSRYAKLWIKVLVTATVLGLTFAYGVGVGLRSWFPYDLLARAHQALGENRSTQQIVSARELASGDYLIHVRHAHRAQSIDIRVADYFEKDLATSDFSAMTCLSEEGRLQAELTGLVFDSLGLAPARIITSGSCRADEHALLAFGRIDARDFRHLYASAIPESQRESHVNAQAHALSEAMQGGLVVIIGHEGRPYSCQPISCLSGLDSREQGGISIIARTEDDLSEVARFSRLTDFFNALAD